MQPTRQTNENDGQSTIRVILIIKKKKKKKKNQGLINNAMSIENDGRRHKNTK
jgi:hypothetical protein